MNVKLFSPMLLPLTGLIVGIFLANHGAGFLTGMILILSGLAIYELISWKSTDPVATYHLRKWHYAWLLTIFTGAGIIVAATRLPEQLPEALTDRTVMAYGHVNEIRSTTTGDRVILELTALMDSAGNATAVAPVKIYGTIPYFPADVDDDIIFPCSLKRIEDSLNTFNIGYATHMARKGILYSAIMGDSVKIKGHTATLEGITYDIRNQAEAFIENTRLAKQTQNFLITILLGDRAYLDEDTRSLFADGGLSHMLALSGMHVSIIAGIILWLLFPFNVMGLYRWRYVIALPALWGYALITGLTPSTVRAAIMMTAVIICMLTERKNSAWNALLLSVFIILLFNPNAVYDIGLQLSFVCVASLIFFAGPLNPVDHHEHGILFNIVAAVLVTLSATAASWVLSSYYFGIFPTLFIPANLIALPLLPLYIGLALVFFASVALGYPLPWIDKILDHGYSGLVSLLSLMQGEDSSALYFDVSALTVILWLMAMTGFAIWLHYKRHKGIIAISSAMAAAAIIMIPFNADATPDAFIIQTRSDRPHILVRTEHKQSDKQFEPNSVSGIIINGQHVITVDCDISGIPKTMHCDYAIITRSCPNNIAEIDSVLNPRVMVLHPSLNREREAVLICEADSLHIPYHSLRHTGPLQVTTSQ